jgi:hypothetical protein
MGENEMRARKENETIEEYHLDLKNERNSIKARKFGVELLYRTDDKSKPVPYVKAKHGPIGTERKTNSQKRKEKRDETNNTKA